MGLKYSVLNTLESVARDDLGYYLVEFKCFITRKRTHKEAWNYLPFPTLSRSTVRRRDGDHVEVEKEAKEVFGKGRNGEVLLAQLSVGKRLCRKRRTPKRKA